MDSKIKQALTRQFEKHRIIFWYDRRKELRDDFEALQLENVEKIELKNNEFSVKYRILCDQPQQKFLLYQEGPQPADLDNWLLDVLLAHGEFRTDQVSIWLGQLELGPEYTDVVADHEDFYRSTKRVEALKRLVDNRDSLDTIRLKMLAVCANTEAQLDVVLEGLLAELALGKDDSEKLIGRAKLDDFLWKRVGEAYGYQSEQPNVKDFAIGLFKACYAMGTGGPSGMYPAALVFFKRWKDGRHSDQAFKTLSEQYTQLLNIEHDLENRDYRTLVDLDYYRLIDQKIISSLVEAVANRTITAQESSEIISERRLGYWYKEFEDLYLAIGYASQFIAALDGLNLSMTSLQDGVQRYSNNWYVLDQLYRKFTYHARRSGQTSLLSALSTRVENLYTNNYLLVVNNNWQAFVDQAANWAIPGVISQRDFYVERVQPYLERNNKIFVIISDALRYEIADELMTMIRQEDRFEAAIEPAITLLPSYTQLGMAALLPHQKLSIRSESGSSVVFVDDKDSRGTENRNKLLMATVSNATAIQSEDLRNMSKEERRAFFRNNDVVYLYHNEIDAVGDKRDSEERVFDAAASTLNELITLIKMLANANASNIIVTADHGFIYQNDELDESDFLSEVPQGQNIINTNRRFVIGQNLHNKNGFKTFTAAQVGLDGDFEVQLPKSINRLRKQGAGSRYVHGGASLQEIVVPVVTINKKRTSDVRRVDVAIVRGANQLITSGQLAVKLYQKEPVSEKIQARTLRIGLFTQDGKLISDSQEIIFDLTTENERDREKSIRLILSKDADAANNKSVYVKLMEREEGTSHEVEYESAEYQLRRSFTSDFDF